MGYEPHGFCGDLRPLSKLIMTFNSLIFDNQASEQSFSILIIGFRYEMMR